MYKRWLFMVLGWFIAFGMVIYPIEHEHVMAAQGEPVLLKENIKAANRIEKSIDVNASYSDQLSAYDEIRKYNFSLASAGKVNITFGHPHISDQRCYWIIGIYNENMECLMQMESEGTETDKTSIDIGLSAGNYYVKVSSCKYERNGQYSLKTYTVQVNYAVSDTWETEWNNGYATADVIAVNTVYNGANQTRNDTDYYKFQLDNAGKVSVNFQHENIMSDAKYWEISIYNNATQYLQGWAINGCDTDVTSVEIGLPEGIYYLKVHSHACGKSSGNYSSKTYALKVNYTASEYWETEGNDGYAKADDITVNTDYNGANQTKNDIDYYKFQLNNAGKVSINFQHENIVSNAKYWQVGVYNDNTEYLLGFDIMAGDTDKTSIEIGLPGGIYYLTVCPYAYNKNSSNYSSKTYTFKVNYTETDNWETEINNSYSTADEILLNKEYYGALQFVGTADYYMFSMEKEGNVILEFNHDNINDAGRYWIVYIYDDNTNQVIRMDINGTDESNRSNNIWLNAGTYYLKVNSAASEGYGSRSSGQTYQFKVSHSFTMIEPQLKISSVSYNKIKLSWDKIQDADGYIIYRSTSKNGKYKELSTIEGNASCKYTDSGVKTGKTYYYKIRAYEDASGERCYSDYSSNIKCKAIPAKVNFKKLTAGKKKATLLWAKQAGASGYEIYMSNKKAKGYKKIKTIKKSSTVKYTKSGLKKGKTYYFKIRSYKMVNGKKVYGSYSKVKSVKIKK